MNTRLPLIVLPCACHSQSIFCSSSRTGSPHPTNEYTVLYVPEATYINTVYTSSIPVTAINHLNGAALAQMDIKQGINKVQWVITFSIKSHSLALLEWKSIHQQICPHHHTDTVSITLLKLHGQNAEALPVSYINTSTQCSKR